MDTRWLEDVLVLLEEGNLSRAAARRHVTQPAFSRRIRAFENWIGTSLMKREANRIALHPSLAEYEDDMRALLQRLGELREFIANHERGLQKIILVSQHALSAGTFPEICRAFVALRPDLTFRLRTLNRRECISVFLRDEADILLCYHAADFPPLSFDREILAAVWQRDSLIPVIGSQLLAEFGGVARVPSNTPLIAYPGESHFGRLVAASEKAGNQPPPNGPKRVTSAFSLGVLQLVRAGMGLGWVPRSLAERYLRTNEIVDLADTFGAIGVEITLYTLRSNRRGVELLSSKPASDAGS